MAFAEIVGALHFLEPADRPFELELAISGRIKSLRFGIGGRQQLDPMFVQRVDQRREPRRLRLTVTMPADEPRRPGITKAAQEALRRFDQWVTVIDVIVESR